MTHKSKVDVYTVAAILLAMLIFVVGDYWIGGPVLLVLLLCSYPESYQTTEFGLLVETALARQAIPYESITYIGPAAEESGAFPLFASRVRVRYGAGTSLLLAPADREAFFTDIATRAPHLIKRGQRLVASFA